VESARRSRHFFAGSWTATSTPCARSQQAPRRPRRWWSSTTSSWESGPFSSRGATSITTSSSARPRWSRARPRLRHGARSAVSGRAARRRPVREAGVFEIGRSRCSRRRPPVPGRAREVVDGTIALGRARALFRACQIGRRRARVRSVDVVPRRRAHRACKTSCISCADDRVRDRLPPRRRDRDRRAHRLNYGVSLEARQRIVIGKRCLVASMVRIGDHARRVAPETRAPHRHRRRLWIAHGVIRRAGRHHRRGLGRLRRERRRERRPPCPPRDRESGAFPAPRRPRRKKPDAPGAASSSAATPRAPIRRGLQRREVLRRVHVLDGLPVGLSVEDYDGRGTSLRTPRCGAAPSRDLPRERRVHEEKSAETVTQRVLHEIGAHPLERAARGAGSFARRISRLRLPASTSGG